VKKKQSFISQINLAFVAVDFAAFGFCVFVLVFCNNFRRP